MLLTSYTTRVCGRDIYIVTVVPCIFHIHVNTTEENLRFNQPDVIDNFTNLSQLWPVIKL